MPSASRVHSPTSAGVQMSSSFALGSGLAEIAETVANVENVMAGERNAAVQEQDRKNPRSDLEFDGGDGLLVAVFQPEPGDGRILKQHRDQDCDGEEPEIGTGYAVDEDLQGFRRLRDRVSEPARQPDRARSTNRPRQMTFCRGARAGSRLGCCPWISNFDRLTRHAQRIWSVIRLRRLALNHSNSATSPA